MDRRTMTIRLAPSLLVMLWLTFASAAGAREAGLLVDTTWLAAHRDDPGLRIVDMTSEPRDYRRGHIPGVVAIDRERNLRPDGTFKPADELRAIHVANGVTPDETVVTYCQTHHWAAHTYFVLRLLGYQRLVGYDRSWSEWGCRDDLPVAR